MFVYGKKHFWINGVRAKEVSLYTFTVHPSSVLFTNLGHVLQSYDYRKPM